MLRGDFATQAQVGINLVRSGVTTPNELREQLGLNPRPEGDKLMPQAVGGRPGGTGDGEGDDAAASPGATPLTGPAETARRTARPARSALLRPARGVWRRAGSASMDRRCPIDQPVLTRPIL